MAGYPLPIDDELSDQLHAAQAARIAAPGATSGYPALNLRGLGAPTPSATENMESAGLASHLAPRPVAAPSGAATRKIGDEAELARKESTGSGVSQIQHGSKEGGIGIAKPHPILGGILRGLDIAGSVIAPAAMQNIPGTTLHHNLETARDRGHIAQDTAEEEKEAQTGQTEAAAEKDRAEATAKLHLAPKEGLTPEETTIHDLMTGENGQPRLNPQTGKPYSYLEAYGAVNQAKQGTKQQLIDAEAAVTNAKTPEEKAAAQSKLDQLKKSISDYAASSQGPEKSGVGNARSDKSYQYNSDKLDKLGKPIEDTVARMGRLRETLAQGSPQADALIAPELLTVMAGGAGSGLRMNEAEISRIVGGRSKWQSLEASINQWRLDPTKANSITPEQRQQIRALVDAVNVKLQKKQEALDQARDSLLNSDDPKEHRKIVTNAHHALTQVDETAPGNQNTEPERTANVPANYVYQQNGPKGEGWYKP